MRLYRSDAIMTPTAWLDQLENLLSHITTLWDGLIIITGDMNIDCLKPNYSITRQYLTLLDVFNLNPNGH